MSLAVTGAVARDLERHFIQRWNFVGRVKANRESGVPVLVPKGELVATLCDRN